jgi:hypothetical protein
MRADLLHDRLPIQTTTQACSLAEVYSIDTTVIKTISIAIACQCFSIYHFVTH